MKLEPTQRRRYKIHPNVPDVHEIVRCEAADRDTPRQEAEEEDGGVSTYRRSQARMWKAEPGGQSTTNEAGVAEGQGRVDEQGGTGDSKDPLTATRDGARTLVLGTLTFT
jgi:hypothetical protein